MEEANASRRSSELMSSVSGAFTRSNYFAHQKPRLLCLNAKVKEQPLNTVDSGVVRCWELKRSTCRPNVTTVCTKSCGNSSATSPDALGGTGCCWKALYNWPGFIGIGDLFLAFFVRRPTSIESCFTDSQWICLRQDCPLIVAQGLADRR